MGWDDDAAGRATDGAQTGANGTPVYISLRYRSWFILSSRITPSLLKRSLRTAFTWHNALDREMYLILTGTIPLFTIKALAISILELGKDVKWKSSGLIRRICINKQTWKAMYSKIDIPVHHSCSSAGFTIQAEVLDSMNVPRRGNANIRVSGRQFF